jgi:hypothetical protein
VCIADRRMSKRRGVENREEIQGRFKPHGGALILLFSMTNDLAVFSVIR